VASIPGVGGGILGFLSGFAEGASKTHINVLLQQRQLAIKQKLDNIEQAVKSGDVALVEAMIKEKDVAGIYDKESQKALIESARMNTPGAKLQRTLEILPQVLQSIGQRQSTQQQPQAQPTPQPQAQLESPTGFVEPRIREETIPPGSPTSLPARPQPQAQPRTLPAEPALRAQPDITTNVSKEGEVSFTFTQKVREIDERSFVIKCEER